AKTAPPRTRNAGFARKRHPHACQTPVSRENGTPQTMKGTLAVFWIQLSTFVLFNLLILAMLTTQIPARAIAFTTGQHARGGEGAYTVWHLIADIEAETREEEHGSEHEHPRIPPEFPTTDPDEPTGRHHLRA
ncbi:hypothetical protein AB0L13_37655, partial [Saccharopolyspora shandongensis]|uniref:hypothetical protein n=1 Tax=Saccharopolyspora shandongensis TaxID=418495 RepID=UPI00344A37E4